MGMTLGKRLLAAWGVPAIALVVAMAVWTLPDVARPASAQQAASVTIGDFFFQPATVNVDVGATVTWTHSGQAPHTVTSTTGAFDSGTMRNGDTFQQTFSQAGTYEYFCEFHPNMVGTVVVAEGQQPTPTATTTPTATATAPPPTPAAPAAQATGISIAITLGPGRDADQSGVAVLTAKGNQTEVILSIKPGPAGVEQPVHIHEGKCPTPGPVKYPLTNIVDGKSTTLVNAPLSDLITGNYSINAHMSQQEISKYVACGNIPQGIIFPLAPGRDADQSGFAYLGAAGPQTEVVLSIKPGPAGVQQPVHIHEGKCPAPGAVKYPLTNVIDGQSRSLVNASLRELQSGNYSINAHRSMQEISVYVACGNIPAGAAPPAPAPSAPRTGNAGLSGSDGGSNGWLYMLIVAGGALMVGGGAVALRRLHSER